MPNEPVWMFTDMLTVVRLPFASRNLNSYKIAQEKLIVKYDLRASLDEPESCYYKEDRLR